MHQINGFCNIRQIQRFFYGGIAAADHGHILAAIKETVTGSARANALAKKRLFTGQTQVLGRSAGSDNQSITGIGGLIAH